MKRTSPITILFAVVAIVAAAIAIQAKSSDSDAKPAVVEVERVAPAVAAPAAQAPVANHPPATKAATKPATRTVKQARPVTRRTVALPPLRSLAASDCREEAFDDAADFRLEFGAGQAGMSRCIAHELRKAGIDCQGERIEDPFDFRAEYGTGADAKRRCMRDTLS
jgi:hypothetical protein